MLCSVVELGAEQRLVCAASRRTALAVVRGGQKLFSGLIPYTFRALDLIGREWHLETDENRSRVVNSTAGARTSKELLAHFYHDCHLYQINRVLAC